jgi:drug/metabolite transporter (DMT)-like permease
MATTAEPPATTSTPSTGAGTAAAVVAVVFWGLGNVLVKHIRLSGVSLAFNRLWIGSLVYTLALYVSGGRLTRRTFKLAALGGIAFGLDVALFFTSLKHTSVADASIITALQPALVFIVAGRLFGERVTARIAAWTVVAVAGVAVAVAGSGHSAGRTTEGDLIAALSLAAWTWYFVASKQSRRQLRTLEYQAAMTIVAAVVVTPVALTAGPSTLTMHDWSTVGWVLVMVCIPGGGHLLMNWAHRYAPIMLTSLATLGVPLVATAGAALVLGEPITLVQSGGMAAVLIALAMVLWRPPAVEVPPVIEPLD